MCIGRVGDINTRLVAKVFQVSALVQDDDNDADTNVGALL